MSLRVLRKIQGGKDDLENLSQENEVQSDKSADELQDSIRIVNNRFNLLEGSQSESEVKEDDDLTEVGDDKIDDILCTSPPHNNPTGARKKRRRKKKKGKCKVPASSEDQMDNDVDEIEMSIREVNAILGEADPQVFIDNSVDEKITRSLLAIEYKHLNPQNEMKRIFGSKVVQSADNNRRRARGRVNNRGTYIVQQNASWMSPPKPGLSMVMVDSGQPYQEFKFQHSPIYQQAQFKFLEAVESFNPENIIYLLNMEPKHVDTLIQVSEIVRLGDDSATAANLITKAIYVMESSAHPLFNIATGNCRIQYRQQENRGLFIALFRHILNVGQKGCYRTALELCKLLLSLSPDNDPLAVTLMMDFYALRAQEYAWLVSLYDSYEPTKNMSLLPNFAYSVPLALYHLSEQDPATAGKEKGDRHKFVSPTEMGTPEEMRKRADEMLQKALIMFPGVLIPLLEKCSIQPDNAVSSHKYFGIEAQTNMKSGLQIIVNLFIGRNYHVWKEPGVVTWLEENVNTVLARVDSDDPLVETCADIRKSKYIGTPTAFFRHILMAEVKDATTALPPALANLPVMSYDPLPPPDSICDYSRPPPKVRQTPATSSNIFQTFVASILPSYNPNEPRSDVDEDALVGEAPAAELRARFQGLLEAMGNLVGDMNLAPTGADDADQSGVEEPEPGEWD